MDAAWSIRPGEGGDVEAIKRAIYISVSWLHQLPALEEVIIRPELLVFWEGWGRPGDFAVVADNPVFVGAAFARLYAAEERPCGFIDAETPELGVGVVENARRQGLGRRLMLSLEDQALEAGFRQLSLCVNARNPATYLYESVGYDEIRRDGEAITMLKSLRRGAQIGT